MTNYSQCLCALQAGEYEAQHYQEWLEDENADCSEFLLNDDDDLYDECERDYFLFLLNQLTIKPYYTHRLLPWVADWWRKHDYRAFWATIWQNPNSGFLFHNRLHLFKMMHSSARRIETNFEARYHLGGCVRLLVNMIVNEDHRKSIGWNDLIENTHPDAMKLAEEYVRDEHDSFLYANMCNYSHHMPLIKKHMHYLFDDNNKYRSLAWYRLCNNKNARSLLEAHRSQWDYEVSDDEGYHEYEFGRKKCYQNIVEYDELVSLITDDVIQQGILHQELWVEKLCLYAHGVSYIEPHIGRIWESCWNRLCENPAAIHLVEKHIGTLSTQSWEYLCGNPNAIHIVKNRNWSQEEWSALVGNPEAVYLIEAHLERLTEEQDIVTFNENKGALKVIEKNPRLIREELLLHPDVFYVV